jgi:glycosyltransferase involved in cell wall biosynthesis
MRDGASSLTKAEPGETRAAPSAPPSIPLSVLIRTLNEADRLGACLEAARQLGAEIVVVDAGSTDATAALAESHGARVVFNPWPGFGPQRRFGEDLCSFDHIFSLDADEIVTPQLAAQIRAMFASGAPPRLAVVRKAMIFPHWTHPPPLGFCHEQVLIYDRRVARTGLNPNWDKLEISVADKPARLPAPLWHFSVRDWRHAITKAAYVAQLAANTQKPRARWKLSLRLVSEFPVTFLKFYFLRRYALGGLDGFAMASITAFGRWLRVAMMLERSKYGRREM